MSRMQAQRLTGGRLHLNDGPIDLVIALDGERDAINAAEDAALTRFASILDELCRELPQLRMPTSARPAGQVARRMWAATLPFASGHFITPMAAVAGAVAEDVLAAMTDAADLARARVNNGGDIALHLAPDRSYRIGLVDRPDRPSLFAETDIVAGHPVRGIATSGWRGRSFSRGIADAVTVLAETASMADAAATIIANAIDLPGHPAIARKPACDLQPDSDLGSIMVTTGVGALTGPEISEALDRGAASAREALRRGLIAASALHLAGMTVTVGERLSQTRPRIAAHA
jgi:uncharacterized protein